MSGQKVYKVMRQHIGDKAYARGDERKADPRKVKRLVDLGVLVPIETQVDDKDSKKPKRSKKAPAAKNKAAPPANNKAGAGGGTSVDDQKTQGSNAASKAGGAN